MPKAIHKNAGGIMGSPLPGRMYGVPLCSATEVLQVTAKWGQVTCKKCLARKRK